jgi:hypothetical protein
VHNSMRTPIVPMLWNSSIVHFRRQFRRKLSGPVEEAANTLRSDSYIQKKKDLQSASSTNAGSRDGMLSHDIGLVPRHHKARPKVQCG